MKLTFFLSLLTLVTVGANAQDKVVESISDGSCWLDSDQARSSVKIASFNDSKSYQIDSLFMDKVSSILKDSLEVDEFKPSKFNINVHCGAYGSSVVLNFVHNNKRYCTWINPSSDTLKLRSFGETSFDDQRSCDGFKIGEYLIALSSDELLQNDFIKYLDIKRNNEQIKKYELISSRYIKIKVSESVNDENSLLKEIKSHSSVIRVERNNFYHPVGDFKFLDMFSIE